MPTRRELRELARLRLKEAEVLFDAGCYNGAAYLCGYVVEVALKARICRLLGIERYPDEGRYKGLYAVHDLDQLFFLSGLKGKITPEKTVLLKNWAAVSPWKPDLRYSPQGTVTRSKALDILDATRDPENGVLKWIKTYW